MSADRPTRLLLAHSQPLLRSGYRNLLRAEPDLDVVGEAGDGAEAVELARRLLPDVAVLGLALPRQDGIEAARAITAARLPVRVLLVGGEPDGTADADLLRALRAGAWGLLDADVTPADLVGAVRAVATGLAALAPEQVRRLVDQVPDPAPVAPPPGLESLTEREREVLAQVACGLSNAEVAGRLGVSETTVKTHVGHVLTKLRLRDRVQAVIFAYGIGLVRPDEPVRGGTTLQGDGATRAWASKDLGWKEGDSR